MFVLWVSENELIDPLIVCITERIAVQVFPIQKIQCVFGIFAFIPEHQRLMLALECDGLALIKQLLGFRKKVCFRVIQIVISNHQILPMLIVTRFRNGTAIRQQGLGLAIELIAFSRVLPTLQIGLWPLRNLCRWCYVVWDVNAGGQRLRYTRTDRLHRTGGSRPTLGIPWINDELVLIRQMMMVRLFPTQIGCSDSRSGR